MNFILIGLINYLVYWVATMVVCLLVAFSVYATQSSEGSTKALNDARSSISITAPIIGIIVMTYLMSVVNPLGI